MTLRRQWAVTVAVVAALGITLFVLNRVVGRQLVLVSVGSHAPAFRGETVDGQPHERTLADYRGDVVLLNVWATYCVPCGDAVPRGSAEDVRPARIADRRHEYR